MGVIEKSDNTLSFVRRAKKLRMTKQFGMLAKTIICKKSDGGFWFWNASGQICAVQQQPNLESPISGYNWELLLGVEEKKYFLIWEWNKDWFEIVFYRQLQSKKILKIMKNCVLSWFLSFPFGFCRCLKGRARKLKGKWRQHGGKWTEMEGNSRTSLIFDSKIVSLVFFHS